MDKMAIAILRAMWHKNRKEFVIWTGNEIGRRCGAASYDMARMVKVGLLKSLASKDRGLSMYEITDLGRLVLKQEGME